MLIILREVPVDEAALLAPLLKDAEEGEERIRATLIDQANTSYLSFFGNIVVGAATLRWQAEESEIIYIAVIREMRGRGYGKAIVAAIFEEMHRRNVQALLVGTANSSLENIAFYQKCGFRMDHVR